MIRRPPRSTRTDTLFPYTTLFRAQRGNLAIGQSDPRADHHLGIDIARDSTARPVRLRPFRDDAGRPFLPRLPQWLGIRERAGATRLGRTVQNQEGVRAVAAVIGVERKRGV